MTGSHGFAYLRPDSGAVYAGDWHPAGRRPPTATVHITRDRDVAESWRGSLAAGRLPETGGAAPPDRD